MKLIFDIETDNYLHLCTVIHCISIQEYETGKVHEFTPSNIKAGLKMLQDADEIIGHNVISFDIPAIKKLYPKWDTNARVYDTLIAAKFAFPDIKERDFYRLRRLIKKPQSLRTEEDKKQLKNIGRHSLEAYGMRLGEYKGDFGKEVGFETFSDDMMKYCTQDVKVNTKLYHKLLSLELDESVLDIEFEARRICNEQQNAGFNFDIEAAYKLKEELEAKQQELQDEIKSKLGGPFIIPLEVKVPTRSVNYKDVLRGCEVKGCPFTKIKVKDFNPTSRHDLTTRLIERYNWKPKEFGKDGKPTLSDEVLKSFKGDIFKTIADTFMIQKRLGMLADGNNAWIKMYNEDTGCIHGGIDTLGTGTHRCTHSRPNLSQIPSVNAPYGKECRSLFIAPKGWKMFDTDLSGLELRMLAHFMYPFDNGEYADVILNGDIHTVNQEAAGLPTRNMAKTFIYGFLYGAGNEKIGSIVGGSANDGRKLKAEFFKKIPAMKKLTDLVKQAAEVRGYIKSLDGRRIPVRSSHSALNSLLQSSGAVVAKRWMVEARKEMDRRRYIHGKDYMQVAYIHDQYDIVFNPKVITGEELGEISKLAVDRAAEAYKVRLPLDIDWSVGDNFSEVH